MEPSERAHRRADLARAARDEVDGQDQSARRGSFANVERFEEQPGCGSPDVLTDRVLARSPDSPGLTTSVPFAAVAAGLTVSRSGAVPPTEDEVAAVAKVPWRNTPRTP